MCTLYVYNVNQNVGLLDENLSKQGNIIPFLKGKVI